MLPLLPLIVALLTVSPAADPSGGEPDGSVDKPADTTPEAMLSRARRLLLSGETGAARADLEALILRSQIVRDVPFAVEAEALVFLGELQLLGGDDDAAAGSFRAILQRDPTYRIYADEHPPSVLMAFEVARAALPAPAPPPALEPVRVPYPWWGYTPFGGPQFQQRRPVRGAVYAVLQASFAAASVGAWVWVDRTVVNVDKPIGTELEREAARRKGALIRDAMAIPSAAAFYVTWAISAGDGAISWRKDHLAPPSVGVAPLDGGAAIAVSGRF